MRAHFAAFVIVGLAACSEPGQAEIARGNVLVNARRYDDAIEAYKAACRAAPKQARPRELLGHALFDRQRWPEARAAYQEALALQPTAALEAQLGLARVDAQEEKLDAAIDRLTTLLERHPESVYARLSRASLVLRRNRPGDAELALADTAAALQLDPTGGPALYTRACAQLGARQLDQAAQTLEALEKAQPGSALAAYGMARVAAARGARLDVLLHLREAKKRARSTPGGLQLAAVRSDSAFRSMKEDPDFIREVSEP